MGSDSMDGSRDWPAGEGEMAGRIRAHDWASTPLGSIEDWPQSLKVVVELMLSMAAPATILWGPSHVQIYNDAYVPVARERHPWLLGQPIAQGWAEAYEEVVAPLLQATHAGRATQIRDLPALLKDANGNDEQRWFDSDITPLRDEGGAVQGALLTLAEVTEHHRAEALARESEARQQLLISSWAQAVWETDAEGLVVTDSPSWRAYTGQSLQQWLGYGWLDAIHPDDRARAERGWREAIAARGLINAEYRLRAPDGTWRWTNVRAAPVLDAHGNVEKWAGMNIDIDDWKCAEEARNDSESRYRTLFGSMDEAFYLVEIIRDEAGKAADLLYLEENEAAVRQTGLSTRGRGLRHVNPKFEQEWLTIIDDVVRSGEPRRFEKFSPVTHRWQHYQVFPAATGEDHVGVLASDISERRAAEQALQDSEARFRRLADDAPVLIWETDEHGGTSMNRRYVEFFGVPPEQLLGTGWMQFIHPDDAQGYLDVYREAFEKRIAFSYECRFLRQDGQYRWLRNTGGPVGQTRFIGCSIDVTDLLDAPRALRKNEQALRANEERLRNVLEGMDEAFGLMDHNLHIITQNKAALTMDGRSLEELRGRKHSELYPKTDPELIALYKRALSEGKPVSLEHRYDWDEERSSWLEMRAFPVPEGIAVFWRDISERKEAEAKLRDSEERYRKLFESMDEAYAVVDVLRDDAGRWCDFRFVEVNPAFLKHTNMSWPVGKTATELLGTPNPRWTKLYGQALDTGEALRVEEREDTLGIIFDLNIFTLDREKNRVAVLFTNITGRKKTEADLRDSEAKFRTLFESIDDGFCVLEILYDEAGNAKDCRYLQVNPAFLKQTGQADPTGLLGSEYAPASAPMWLATYDKVVRSGKPTRFEQFHPDSGRWYSVNASIIGEQGSHLVASVFADVTERRQAETELRESKEHQAFLLKFSDALRAEEGVDAVAGRAITLLRDHLQLDRAYITFYRPEEDQALFPYQTGNERVPALPASVRLSDFPDAYKQVLHHTYVIEDDFERRGLTAEERANSAALGMRAMLASTIRKGEGYSLCSMVAVAAVPRRWSPSEIRLVEDAAERTWQAMQRARIETDMRESEERLSLALEVGQFASWDWDLRTGEVTWNDRHFLLQGYAVGEVTPSFDAWIARVHPDDREHALAAIEQARISRQPYANEMRSKHPDGMVRWCSARGSFFYDSEGNATRMIGIMEDVTDRKLAADALQHSEARFRHFGEASSDLLWIRDSESLRFEYLSPAFERLYGTSREQLLAHDHVQAWLDLIHPEDRALARDVLSQLQAGKPANFEFRVCRPDGQMRWLRNTDFPLVDDTGHVRRIAGIAHDITGEKRAVDLQATLLAELQHRVRNLLAMIRSVTRRASIGKENVSDFVDHLEGRIDAMARTQAMLTRSPGRQIDLQAIIEEELLAQGADPKQFRLSGPATGLAPKVAEVVTLAIHELTTNSVKYGALGRQGAFFFVSWGKEQHGDEVRVTLTWRELGVPIEGRPRSGFGTELLTRRVPFELGGNVQLEFLPEGLTATLEFPLRQAGSVLQTDADVTAGE